MAAGADLGAVDDEHVGVQVGVAGALADLHAQAAAVGDEQPCARADASTGCRGHQQCIAHG
jgi:hypothetical protein